MDFKNQLYSVDLFTCIPLVQVFPSAASSLYSTTYILYGPGMAHFVVFLPNKLDL